MMKVKRNTEGLRIHTENRKAEAEERANASIDKMKFRHKEINFKTVSEHSGVSTTTLYNNAKLRKRIESLRAAKPSKEKEIDIERERRAREKELRQQIAELKEEKEMLIKQLVEMDKIEQENQYLKKILSAKKRE